MRNTSRFYILLLLLLLAAVLLSCSKQGTLPVDLEVRSYTSKHSVTISNLRKYFSSVKGIPETKSDAISVEPVVNGTDTVMFVVNYDKGWEVLSGDLRVPVVLAKSDTGNISLADLSSTPESSMFFASMSDGLSSIIHNDDFTPPGYVNDTWNDFFPIDSLVSFPSVKDTVLVSIDTLGTYVYSFQDHLMSTKWGQGYPWNQYAPYRDSTMTSHCPTGCVPVAFAQVLYYLHSKFGVPSNIYGEAACNAFLPSDSSSLELYDSDVTFSDYSDEHWESMPMTQASSGDFGPVSALMVRLGYLFNASYRQNSTGVTGEVIRNSAESILANEFNLSASYIDYMWTSFPQYVSEQIFQKKLPMLMGISGPLH